MSAFFIMRSCICLVILVRGSGALIALLAAELGLTARLYVLSAGKVVMLLQEGKEGTISLAVPRRGAQRNNR